MHLIIAILAALALAMIAHHLLQRMRRIPRVPLASGDWGSGVMDTGDPRVAVAAMMYAVATEDGPLTAEEERHILSLLASRVGLDPDLAEHA